MCEIQFVIGKDLNKYTIDEFLNLLHSGSYGNADATGIFGEGGVLLKWNTAFYKLPFERSQQVWKQLANSETRWLIGHNRLATQGSETLKKNNHPFRNDTCSVVHNGIITNDDILKEKYKLNYPEQTDSAIIPHLISHYFTDDTDEVQAIKLAMEKITGSYSIFVFMHASQNLYYLRNTGSLFEFMRAERSNGEVLIYGSTKSTSLSGIGAATMNGVFAMDSLRSRTKFTPSSGRIYQIVVPEMNIKEVASFTPKIGNYTYTAYDPAQSGQGNIWAEATDTTKISKRQRKRQEQAQVREALKESDVDIQEYWDIIMDEMDYLSGLYAQNDNIDAAFQEAAVSFHDKSQTVVVENISEVLADQFDLYLRARKWYPQNTILTPSTKGTCNFTVQYKEVLTFVENNHSLKRDLAKLTEGEKITY